MRSAAQPPALPIELSRLQWEARYVLRDRRGTPHLYLRIRLRGGLFPKRGVFPFVQVGPVRSAFAEITPDEQIANGYFDEPLPEGASVEFGFGWEAILRCGRRFSSAEARQLDPRLVPRETRNVDCFLRPEQAAAFTAFGGRPAALPARRGATDETLLALAMVRLGAV